MYDTLSVVGFKGLDEEQVLEAMIEAGIDVEDIETEDDSIVIYGATQDLYNIKEAILNVKNDINFDAFEITTLPKEKVTLQGEELEQFKKLLTLLDDVDDVQNVYHNVELGE